MKSLLHLIAVFAVLVPVSPSAADDRSNVLFVAIDDLNDWVSLFGGHSGAMTPHLEAFAESGSVVFQNAHCAAPVCGPSRSALLSGFMPNRSGVYGNSQNMLKSELIQTHATIPEYFSKNGYFSVSRGKIFHAHQTMEGLDRGGWAFEDWSPTERGSPVDKSRLFSRDKNIINGKPGPKSKYTKSGGSEFAWGPTVGPKEATSDYKTAMWAVEELQKSADQPFFMAVGFSKPHLPFYSPQEFFDLYEKTDFKANEIREDDLSDILKPNGQPKFRPHLDYLWLKENDLIDVAARAYMACCSYADACLGALLAGLAKSPHADNTIVVVWGDHGWHLGEKLQYRKAKAWSESTRVPLLIRLPGMTKREDCLRTVNLIDLYPTLIELCGLPEKPEIDGRSLAPLLKKPTMQWDYPSITMVGEGDVSIGDERWRYIRYVDGTEELYDHKNDPMEWNNLAAARTPELDQVIRRLAAVIPETFAAPVAKQTAGERAQARKQQPKVGEKWKIQRDLSALR